MELRVNIVDSRANAVDAKLTYPADKIEVTGITSSAAFPSQFGDSYGSGTISITHFTYSSVSGDQLVATIDLRAKNVLGQAEINIDKSSSTVTADDGNGTNILTSVSGATYTIANSTGGNTPSNNQEPATSVQPSKPIGQPTQLNSTQQQKPQSASSDSNSLQPAAPESSVTSTLSGNVSQQAAQPSNLVSTAGQNSWIINVLKIVGSFGLAFAALELRNLNRRRRYQKTGKKHTPRVHETVADIAKRVNSKDRANETVAELAARLHRQNKAGETVAELAARLRPKKAKKPVKRKRKKKSKS